MAKPCLEVAVEPAYHEQLLELLWTLHKAVELALQPGRHHRLLGTTWCSAKKCWSLNVEKALAH